MANGVDTSTPQFKQAVAQAAAEVVADAAQAAAERAAAKVRDEMLAMMAKAAPAISEGGSGESQNLFRQMALAIAEISDQGSNRKRVAPEILAQRAAAHLRMMARLEQARADGETPEYRLRSKIYFNERFVEPFYASPDKSIVPNEIMWTGTPNEAMVPINDCAKEIYALFRESIGVTEKSKGTDNRPLYITPKGLVVKGDPPKRAIGQATPDFGEGMTLASDPHDPTAPFIHVLGTVAAPVRQNAPAPQQYGSR